MRGAIILCIGDTSFKNWTERRLDRKHRNRRPWRFVNRTGLVKPDQTGQFSFKPEIKPERLNQAEKNNMPLSCISIHPVGFELKFDDVMNSDS
jgi:hypothetical protein